jgi:hypothetical protein
MKFHLFHTGANGNKIPSKCNDLAIGKLTPTFISTPSDEEGTHTTFVTAGGRSTCYGIEIIQIFLAVGVHTRNSMAARE